MTTQAHTNPAALREGTWDHAWVTRELSPERGGHTYSEQELHEHYASNARACGHRDDCMKIELPVNWPTMFGRPLCTCGKDSACH